MVAASDWPRARVIAERIDADLAEHRARPESDDGWMPEPA
jgi:hypothetical protein